MTSPIDFVTGGLGQASGLSLTTGGLLVLTEVSGIPGASPSASRARVDARLLYDADNADADLAIVDGDLLAENSFLTAVILSLFCDRRASEDELARHGGEDARGWWGDSLAAIDGDEWGSKLWLLQREKQTEETRSRAREFAQQALVHFIEDGICSAVNVTALYPRRGLLGLVVELVRASAPRERFAFVWSFI